MQPLPLEVQELFSNIYNSNLLVTPRPSNLPPRWNVTDNLIIEALHLDLLNRKDDIPSIYEEYIDLFDNDFKNYLGWVRPSNELELLHYLETLLNKETQTNSYMYYAIKSYGKIIGVLYFYDYKNKYGKANISIGLKQEFRGKKLAVPIMQSVINNLMLIENPILIRLGLEVETTNTISISSAENSLKSIGFEKDGLLRNNYGKGIDCYIYSFVI